MRFSDNSDDSFDGYDHSLHSSPQLKPVKNQYPNLMGPPKQQYAISENFELVDERNSNGKQYNDEFRRGFIKTLLSKAKGQDPLAFSKMVQTQAEKIHVFVNQVSCWLATYKIIFKIEDEMKKNQLREERVVERIQEHMIEYLNQNPGEKKYKFIRIAAAIFKLMNVRKCTGNHWLKVLMERHKNKVSRDVALKDFLEKKPQKKKYMHEDTDEKEEPRQKVKKIKKFRGSQDYKRSISEELDRRLQGKIKEVFREKEMDTNIDMEDLKMWYYQYGKFDIFQKKRVN